MKKNTVSDTLPFLSRKMNSENLLRLFLCCVSSVYMTANAAKSDEFLSVKVGYLPMVSSLAYFVAMDKDYFLDERLRVDASPIKTSDGLASELGAGHIDMAVELSITPLLQNIGSSGPQFRIFSISKIEDATAFDGVLVKPNSPAKSLKELSGKKIAVFPGSTAKVCFEDVFKRLYPSIPPPIFDNQIKPAEQLNALMRGDVDAVHAYEPIVTIGIDKFGLRRIFGSIYAAQLSPNPIGVAALSKEFATQNKEGVKRVLRAMDKAVHFIETNPDDARAILAKYTGAEMKIASRMHIMPMSESSEIDTQNLDKYIEILRHIGLVQSQVKAKDICLNTPSNKR